MPGPGMMSLQLALFLAAFSTAALISSREKRVTLTRLSYRFQLTINNVKAAADVDLSANTAWNMDYKGGAKDTLALSITDAKIARVTADLSNAPKAATITWTLAAGNAQ